jgi:hypothetical protein
MSADRRKSCCNRSRYRFCSSIRARFTGHPKKLRVLLCASRPQHRRQSGAPVVIVATEVVQPLDEFALLSCRARIEASRRPKSA